MSPGRFSDDGHILNHTDLKLYIELPKCPRVQTKINIRKVKLIQQKKNTNIKKPEVDIKGTIPGAKTSYDMKGIIP